jgi:hypothetical protein
MKTKEEIQEQINMYKHFIQEWIEDDETRYHYEIKLMNRLIRELEWILE